jgi:hypothetical protein
MAGGVITRVLAALVAAVLLTPAEAHADPSLPNPHDPIFVRGYCPGNRAQEWTAYGRCDGWPYADGSFWRVTGLGFTEMSRECVVGVDFNVSPAPPGGCGGAVKP